MFSILAVAAGLSLLGAVLVAWAFTTDRRDPG